MCRHITSRWYIDQNLVDMEKCESMSILCIQVTEMTPDSMTSLCCTTMTSFLTRAGAPRPRRSDHLPCCSHCPCTNTFEFRVSNTKFFIVSSFVKVEGRRIRLKGLPFWLKPFWLKPFLFEAILLARVGLLFFFSSIASVVDGEESEMGSRRQFTGRSVEDYFARASSTLGSLGETAQPVSRSDPPARSKAQQKFQCENRSEEEGSAAGCAPATGVHHTGRCTSCSPPASWEIGSSSFNVGGRRRDCCSHPGCFDESPCPGTGTAFPGTCRVHEEVRGEAAEEGRTGPCECHQGQGGFGRSSGLPGERRIFVGRWGRELSQLRAAAQRVPSPFTVPPVPVVPDITDEMQRMQGVIDELQRELTQLKGSPVCRPVDATAKDDEGMGLDGSSIMSGLINDAQAKRPRLALCGGGALGGSPS